MAEQAGRRRRTSRDDRTPHGRPPHDEERGLRGLVGAGSTQVSGSAAMRARDAARPTEADEATAEREVRLVRRNYLPPAPGSSGSTRDRS